MTNSTLLWVHSDHLNRPVKMLNAAQAVVWEAVYEPFGTVHSITGAAANDNRFPGQLFQLETGLAYNWHRHYDATTGRYTQADPLGLETLLSDGPSVYNYALQSPLMYTDPTGEFAWALGGRAASGIFSMMSRAARKAANPAIPKSRICLPGRPEDRCKDLHNQVEEAKNDPDLRACRGGMSQSQLRSRHAAWLRLARARAKRDETCWDGGDAGHQQAQSSAWENAGKCSQMMQ